MRRGHKGHFGRVLARGGFADVGNQAHFQRAVSADGFKFGQCLLIAVDVLLQLGALVADVGGVEENGGNAGINQRGGEGADAGHFELVHQIAGGKHGAAFFTIVGGVEKFDLHFGGGKGHAVELEIAGFLHLAAGDLHMGDDGFADIGLPDAHGAQAV